MTELDSLVEDYLNEVSAALPQGRRKEIVADLREHIAVARAELRPPTEAGIRTILDRLGEPAAIAEEARLAEPGVSHAAAAPSPRWRIVVAVLGFVLIVVLASVWLLTAQSL